MILCALQPLPSTYPPRVIFPAPKSAENGRGSGQLLRLSHLRTTRRGISVVTRAGPSATNYIAALVLPLSLLAVTILASIRVADKLDEKFLEELAINEAILEAEENVDDGDNDKISISLEKESTPAPPRRRNRPKREVEPSSK